MLRNGHIHPEGTHYIQVPLGSPQAQMGGGGGGMMGGGGGGSGGGGGRNRPRNYTDLDTPTNERVVLDYGDI